MLDNMALSYRRAAIGGLGGALGWALECGEVDDWW